MVSAVVLAGSRQKNEPVASSEHLPSKALVEICGSTALKLVVEALSKADIERIVVVCDPGPVWEAAIGLGAETMAPGPGPSESVLRALELIGPPLLVTTADHPLLRPEWICQFIADAPRDADAVTMLAPRAKVEAAVPETQRTWLKFSDGDWSGCNLFLLQTDRAILALRVWRQVEADRKRPWRIARRIGPVTLGRYVLGMLSSTDAFAALGRKIGICAAVVEAGDGLAAVDVDTVADLQLVRAIMAARLAGQDKQAES